VLLHVGVLLVSDIEDDRVDGAARERELRRVLCTDGLAAVVAAAQPFAGQTAAAFPLRQERVARGPCRAADVVRPSRRRFEIASSSEW
jgi:hypothetical protein